MTQQQQTINGFLAVSYTHLYAASKKGCVCAGVCAGALLMHVTGVLTG